MWSVVLRRLDTTYSTNLTAQLCLSVRQNVNGSNNGNCRNSYCVNTLSSGHQDPTVVLESLCVTGSWENELQATLVIITYILFSLAIGKHASNRPFVLKLREIVLLIHLSGNSDLIIYSVCLISLSYQTSQCHKCKLEGKDLQN